MHVKNLKCEICGHGTNRKRDLERHVESVHMQIKRFSCQFCEFGTCWEKSLKSHIETFHAKEEISNIKAEPLDLAHSKRNQN